MVALKPSILFYCVAAFTAIGVYGVAVDLTLSVDGGIDASPSKVASGWYAGWHYDKGFPLSKICWEKYTHLTYAFAESTPNINELSLEGSNPEVLPQFVEQAHKHHVKALASLGGWAGSRFISTHVGSPENRTQFVKTVLDFVKKYDLDGIDIDWEYPGRQGIGCNAISPDDSNNFLEFLREIRSDPHGKKLVISAAVAVTTFAGPDGKPLQDVSEFAKVLDWVAIMNYDVWGPWSATTGPNAPLDDTCADPANRFGSAVSAVSQWHAAGFPACQIVLAVPAYGHGVRVRRADAFVNGTDQLALYTKFDANDRPVGDAWDDPDPLDKCGVAQPHAGTFNFWGLIENGFLNQDGSPANGIVSIYDTCSQTPYVYNPDSEIMVSYDNCESFRAKGAFIKGNGLRGFSTWEIGGDSNDLLLNAIRDGAGYDH